MKVLLLVIQVSTGLPLPWMLLTQYFPHICFNNVFIISAVVCTCAILQLNCYIQFFYIKLVWLIRVYYSLGVNFNERVFNQSYSLAHR
jgi:hypothetical protein